MNHSGYSGRRQGETLKLSLIKKLQNLYETKVKNSPDSGWNTPAPTVLHPGKIQHELK